MSRFERHGEVLFQLVADLRRAAAELHALCGSRLACATRSYDAGCDGLCVRRCDNAATSDKCRARRCKR